MSITINTNFTIAITVILKQINISFTNADEVLNTKYKPGLNSVRILLTGSSVTCLSTSAPTETSIREKNKIFLKKIIYKKYGCLCISKESGRTVNTLR